MTRSEQPRLYAQFALCMLMSTASFAQFSYVGAGFGYAHVNYSPNSDKSTAHNAMVFEMAGMYRPLRFLGVGLAVSLPASQRNSFDFSGGYGFTSSYFFGSSPFYNFDSRGDGVRARYSPYEYKYVIKQGVSISANARLFLEERANFYVEFRALIFSISEEFRLSRFAQAGYQEFDTYYGDVPALNLQYTGSKTTASPGVSVGIMPHTGKKVFIDANVGWDFLALGDPSFSYKVDYNWNTTYYEPEYIQLNGQVSNSKTRFSFKFLVGYVF